MHDRYLLEPRRICIDCEEQNASHDKDVDDLRKARIAEKTAFLAWIAANKNLKQIVDRLV